MRCRQISLLAISTTALLSIPVVSAGAAVKENEEGKIGTAAAVKRTGELTKRSSRIRTTAVRSESKRYGGLEFGAPVPVAPEGPVVPGSKAKLVNGIAHAPVDAPRQVQKAIWAANEIIGKPYIYGGGHRSFIDRGYDCSGTISYALHGGDLLDTPLHSRAFYSYGEAGKGDWITIYTNPGHAYAVIAGLRLDTSGAGPRGPKWQKVKPSDAGFRARHPVGF